MWQLSSLAAVSFLLLSASAFAQEKRAMTFEDVVVFKNSIVLMLLVYWSTLVVHAIGLHGCERRSIHSLSSLPPSQDG